MTDQTIPSHRYWLGGKRDAEQDRFFRDVLDLQNWVAGDDDKWDTGWFTGMPDPSQFKKVSPRRKLNHFPGNAVLTVKSRLHDTLVAVRDRIAESFGPTSEAVLRMAFFPRVYSMPNDYHDLQQAALAHPDKRWILKPTNASKGKGIRVLRDVADTPLGANWMVQEYLANPHTIRARKYVLRLYVLVSSIEPLRVYLYRQGFAKLASEPYDPDDVDNLFSQLTNPDINALNIAVEVPVEFIDLDRYRQWLRDQGLDDERLFARIHDLVTLTVIAATDAIRQRTAHAGADPRGCYELLGLDCMVDDQLKPWILECNLSPSLSVCAKPESGGLAEEAIKRALVEDMISLVGIDHAQAASESASAADGAGPTELAHEAQEEQARAGGFLRLFPSAEPARYLPYFTLPSLADMQLADGLAGRPVTRPTVTPWQVAEVLDDDQLALYASRSGRYYRLNHTAALIWLLATQGLDLDAIVEHLTRAAEAPRADTPHASLPDRQELRGHVWDCLAQWCRDGLLRQRAGQGDVLSPFRSDTKEGGEAKTVSSCQPMRLVCGDRQWILHTDSAPVFAHLSSLLHALLFPHQGSGDGERLPRLEILRDSPGYTLAAEGKVLASQMNLAELGRELIAHLARQAASSEQLVIDAALLSTAGGDAAIYLFPATDDGRALAQKLASRTGLRVTRGLRLNTGTLTDAEPLGLPVDIRGFDGNAMSITLPNRVRVRAVILVDHHARKSHTVRSALSTLDALGALLPCSFTDKGKPLSATTVTALTEWLSRCARLTLHIETTNRAVQRLAGAEGESVEGPLAKSLEALLLELLAPPSAVAGVVTTS